jgi:hypothetical protein
VLSVDVPRSCSASISRVREGSRRIPNRSDWDRVTDRRLLPLQDNSARSNGSLLIGTSTRQDRHTSVQVAAKDIYIYPLCRGFRKVLQGWKTAEELLREFAENPAGLGEYAARLQERLAEAQREKELKEQQLAEAPGIVTELKRELFGARADKLNPASHSFGGLFLRDECIRLREGYPLSGIEPECISGTARL